MSLLTSPRAPHPQEKCHQYWPAERSARYQYFVVDPMAEYNMPQYILREFKVTDARVSVPFASCLLCFCQPWAVRGACSSSRRDRKARSCLTLQQEGPLPTRAAALTASSFPASCVGPCEQLTDLYQHQPLSCLRCTYRPGFNMGSPRAGPKMGTEC